MTDISVTGKHDDIVLEVQTKIQAMNTVIVTAKELQGQVETAIKKVEKDKDRLGNACNMRHKLPVLLWQTAPAKPLVLAP